MTPQNRTMPILAILFGDLILLAGILGNVFAGHFSPTTLLAIVPGALIAVCGALAMNPKFRKHAMHVAATLALVLILGSAPAWAKLPAAFEEIQNAPSAQAVLTGTAADRPQDVSAPPVVEPGETLPGDLPTTAAGVTEMGGTTETPPAAQGQGPHEGARQTVRPVAVFTRSIVAALALVFLLLCVNSFIAARRQSSATAE